jgi:GNAT superfamily N-acetyltransferase
LSASVAIRAAEPDDAPLLFSLVMALAEFERAPERVTATEAMLAEALFGERPVAEAAVAELDGAPAGFALFYSTFSTWQCLPGLWLEDLFVLPERRRVGVGLALLGHLAAVARARGCGRVEWAALDWNTPAIDFYLGLDAEALSDWTVFRLEGEPLARLPEHGPRN